MKRADNLYPKISDFNNLRIAYLKAVRHKRLSPSALNFDRNADHNLCAIKKKLDSCSYTMQPYRQFKIYDPKERVITAAAFEDRIVHHAIMNVLESVFERQFIFHSYACRKGKGLHKALSYVSSKARACRYFLKLDVRKYFDSISHAKLKELLCRIIKDGHCLNLLFFIIDSYEVALKDKDSFGLPIGNLTSQFFANYYLSPLDHFVLEKLNPSGYVRYMDDIIVFSNSMANLKRIFSQMKDFISAFDLTFKQPQISLCKSGIPFLGFLIDGKTRVLLRKNKNRKQKKIKSLTREFESGLITEQKYSCRLGCILTI